MEKAKLTYVLITPVKNEAEFIERTIKSVVSQTTPPLKWVVVSDGSTDGTDEIVKPYVVKHDWIELVRMPEGEGRHFAGKVHAFNAGYARVSGLRSDVIGNLDGDIEFESDYIAFLLSKFADNPRLGVTGTPFREGSDQYDYRFSSTDHVSGACQLFRRECLEDVGGYLPLEAGGEDLAAVTTARMKGWQTKTFTEKAYEHHKKTQYGGNTSLAAIFRSGYHDYLMGSHPVWQLFRSVYQMTRKPVFIGGSALLVGYFWGVLRQAEKIVPKGIVDFRRREQMQRLGRFLKSPPSV